MHPTTLYILTLFTFASALTNPFYNVPACARSCASTLPANCDGDPKCICQSQEWMWGVTCCVANACGSADQVTTFQFANQLCGYVGVSVSQPPSCAVSSKLPSATLATGVKTGTATATPGVLTNVNGYTSAGCYSEASGGGARALNETYQIDPVGMTVEKCVAFCQAAGKNWAGLEYSQECWCGSAIVNGGAKLADESGCNLPCKGNIAQTCGGMAKLSVWNK